MFCFHCVVVLISAVFNDGVVLFSIVITGETHKYLRRGK